MQFLSVSRRRTDVFPPEAFTPELIEAEGQRIRELYAQGIVRSIWRRQDTPGAAVLLEASSEEEARAVLATLPLAQHNMLELVLLTQLLPYPGFGPRSPPPQHALQSRSERTRHHGLPRKLQVHQGTRVDRR
jgi:muconolactone delta-isomerase